MKKSSYGNGYPTLITPTIGLASKTMTMNGVQVNKTHKQTEVGNINLISSSTSAPQVSITCFFNLTEIEPSPPYIMASRKPVPGILVVNSDVIKPNELSRKGFDDWYCDEHIPDVVAKSGITSAARYEHIADGSSPARRLGFLTIYGMPDINFMETDEYRGLEGQSPGPSRERIFKKAEFDTRAYELVQVDVVKGADTTGNEQRIPWHEQH